MSPLSLLTVAFSISITVSYGHLRLKKFCDGGEHTGTNLTLVHADGELDCARACGLNTDCNFMSYHGNECTMYTDEPVCETGVGTTGTLYKVGPSCHTGWYRYSGSCYFVVQDELKALNWLNGCKDRDSDVVAIGDAAENEFLAQLLRTLNMTNTTMWVGGANLPFVGWQWKTGEPWAFQNWGVGEPGSDMCISMNSTDGTWQTESCLTPEMVGICEKTLQ